MSPGSSTGASQTPVQPEAAVVRFHDVVEQLEKEKAELQAQFDAATMRWEREKSTLQARLEFVEEIVGPTEAQRKDFQLQLASARVAALHARHRGAAIPTRFIGRLDEIWLRSRGLSERDCALLQRGCISGHDSVPQDISLLGDPNFRPYDQVTLKPRWDAVGGLLRLSLKDVRNRWGEEVALEVVRCAIELDKYDASRRMGLELPWDSTEGRELQAAEIIAILERELAASGALEAEEVLHYEDSPSPAPSVIESVYSLGGGDRPAPAARVASPTTEELYEWSLADGDIEQLLLREAPHAKSRGPRAPSSTGPSDSLTCSLNGQTLEDENTSVLEFLEEEVTGSLGLFSSASSDYGDVSER